MDRRWRYLSSQSLPSIEAGTLVADRTLDAVGLACPGPIMKLSGIWTTIADGETLAVKTTDRAFSGDLPQWCIRNKATLLGIETDANNVNIAYLSKGKAKEIPPRPAIAEALTQSNTSAPRARTFLIATDVPEKVLVALMAASTWAALGERVVLFFIFSGINNLLKGGPKVPPTKIGKSLFATGTDNSPCPDGPCRIMSVFEFITQLQDLGAELTACGMALDAMGLTTADLVDGVTEGGMMTFVAASDDSSTTISVF